MYILRRACPGRQQVRPLRRKILPRLRSFPGHPVCNPGWIVIERASGREHGPFDSEAEAVACLVFARLARHEVEIVSDAPVTATLTGRM